MSPAEPYNSAIDVLVLCTGNICRSPMAEAVLGDLWARRGINGSVSSAGLVFDDRPAEPHAVTVMAERGLDIGAHRSRVMTEELVGGADLVIGMERRHVREAAALVADAWPRSFTLKELVRRGREAGARDPSSSADEWIAALADGRRPTDHVGEHPDDTVSDPIGSSKRRFRHCAAEIVELSSALTDLLYPPALMSSGPPLPDAAV